MTPEVIIMIMSLVAGIALIIHILACDGDE